ncbi:DUF2865 domain-containing protein [Ancylobacter amanitiformis]|uniref:DUF2865 domain-containing protein n=1 Tax=Ancylobacter amanitiformis TaxID=217069 RepID=A0ABU0LMQ7_9HYPH|nr:DUF2865 domain-containing protein [Ancylobacter amanitiformis]MDQ0509972.1 hypothetical protein [Ancylobacter amanitiformis]
MMSLPSRLRLFLSAVATVACAGLALAQDVPPGALGGGQPGDRSVCIRLEGQLAALDRGGGGGQQDLGAVINQQRQTLADLTAQVRQLGCDKRGFLIFQPQLPPQCEALNGRLQQARSALDRTMSAAQGQRSGNDEQRRQLVYALAQNNCGAQYQAAIDQSQGGGGNAQQRRAPRNFFEQLFGVPRQPEEEAGPIDQPPLEMPKVSTYRTVCVRTCDGFFFPVSYAATPARFSADEASCQRQCPGTEARLFAYRNPGEDIQQAVATNGQPYMSLPNALLFKKQFVATCSCRPAGMSWAQALGQQDDATLRKGDIVVTEDASREMAQPRPATPVPANATKKP